MMPRHIAIIGGGPSALFLYKKIVEHGLHDCKVDVFEAGSRIGCGMPYSTFGASKEHITNISSDETPSLPEPLDEWIKGLPLSKLEEYSINPYDFSSRKTVPRLLFGDYLESQFEFLIRKGIAAGIKTTVHRNTKVIDIIDEGKTRRMTVLSNTGIRNAYDMTIICTGHFWPTSYEGKIKGYFDSPYPPSKLVGGFNNEIAIRGSSLTAIDAIRTLANYHGSFSYVEPHKLSYKIDEKFQNFKITMHSKHGLLPAVRFHFDDPELEDELLFSADEIEKIRQDNEGFVPLDLIFQRKFKDILSEKDPIFFANKANMNLEDFVSGIMKQRESRDPFDLLRIEYAEAQQSIKEKQSIYWKEIINALSFVINYPAKHLSAEDMLRLKNTLQPLIAVIIAYVPQRSCEELIALHDAGHLALIATGEKSHVECLETGINYHYVTKAGRAVSKQYETFIDCIGQPHLPLESFPFTSLVEKKVVSRAFVDFRAANINDELLQNTKDIVKTSDHFRLYLSGIAINDDFQALNDAQEVSERLHVMAVPYMSGHNPDYSGLDFCNEAAERIVGKIAQTLGDTRITNKSI